MSEQKNMKTREEALKIWKKEAAKMVQKAEEEGRELTKDEKVYLKERKKILLQDVKEYHRSQRIEKKKKLKELKAQSQRVIRRFKEDYETRKKKFYAKWKKEVEKAKERARQEGRELTKEEKKKLKAKKKRFLAKLKEEFKSQKLSVKMEIKEFKEKEKEERRSQRIERKKEKERERARRAYEYNCLKEKYINLWQDEVLRVQEEAEEKGRSLSKEEKKNLLRLKKKYMSLFKEEWRKRERERKERERREKEEEEKIRQKIGEPSRYFPVLAASGLVLFALVFGVFFFSSESHGRKVREKKSAGSSFQSAKQNGNIAKSDNKKQKKPLPTGKERVSKISHPWEKSFEEAKKMESQSLYHQALLILEKIEKNSHDTMWVQKARNHKKWILSLAQEEFDDLVVEFKGFLEIHRFSRAAKTLKPVLKKWGLPEFKKKALLLLKELGHKKALWEEKQRLAKIPKAGKDWFQKLDHLESRFNFEKALSFLEEGKKRFRLPSLFYKFKKREIQAKIRILQRFQKKLENKEALVSSIPISKTLVGKPFKSRKDVLIFKCQGSSVGIPYFQLRREVFPKLFLWKDMNLQDHLDLALFFYSLGLIKNAHHHWITAWRENPKVEKEIFAYLAYKKKIAPEKAHFQVFRGYFLTDEEKAYWIEKDEVQKRIKLFSQKGKDAQEIEKFLKGLSAKGRVFARKELEGLIQKLFNKYRKEIKKFKKLAALKKELNRRRKEALRRIFDKSRYYKKKNKEVVGQDWVDEAVEKVRELWNHPFKALTHLSSKWKKRAFMLQTCLHWYKILGGQSKLSKELEILLEQSQEKLSLRWIAINEKERRYLQYARKVLAYNKKMASKIHGLEAKQIAITNEYRMMMGLHPLKIDLKLTRAARKHSQEMKKLGYFDHTSPVAKNRTPSKRARNEGYTKGLVGENIYMGLPSPLAAHKGWYNSPPHHRNILYYDYEDLGVGNYMDHWTQNFGGKGKFKLPK